MELGVHCGGSYGIVYSYIFVDVKYICIYLSMGCTYSRYSFHAKSLFRRIHARMDNGARGILLHIHAVYMPPAIPTHYDPPPY